MEYYNQCYQLSTIHTTYHNFNFRYLTHHITKQLIFYTGVPTIPVISTSTSIVKENNILKLRCSARSTTILPDNLPSDLNPTREYRWQRDNNNLINDGRHIVSGNTLTIDKVQRQDNKIAYRCIAQESGSKYSNTKAITLNVLCKQIVLTLIYWV